MSQDLLKRTADAHFGASGYVIRFIVFVSVVVIGCAPTDRATLIQEVLGSDPSFKPVLEKHDEYASRIETMQREFSLKRETVKRAMEDTRKDLSDSLQRIRERKRHFEELLERNRERINLDISTSSEKLRAKRAQRSSVGRSVSKVRKIINSGDETWSVQERQNQKTQLAEMTQDAERLDQEIEILQKNIRISKVKLLLLRL